MDQQTKGLFDGLNLKPDIQTILVSDIVGQEHDGGNPKTPGVDAGLYWGVNLCTTELHLMTESVLPASMGSISGCHNNKICSVSTCVEVVLSEVE